MAWNKRDDQPNTPEPAPAAPRPMTSAPAASFTPAPEAPRSSTGRATIGPSIIIKGDLSGDEDLIIEGRVEGKVDLKQHNVTIGSNGRVKADIIGKVVTIEGEVDGNVYAQEQAILRKAGAIRGNISAPRVMLEDGSRFKGSIDMEAREPNSDRQEGPRPASGGNAGNAGGGNKQNESGQRAAQAG